LAHKRRKYRKKAGLPPGTLLYTGAHNTVDLTIDVWKYNSQDVEDKSITSIELEKFSPAQDYVYWVDMVGLHDTQRIYQLGQKFDIHQLQLEDVLNTTQRPKAEVSDTDVFLTLRMLQINDGEIEDEQVSFYLTSNILISLQERPGDVFDPIRERIKKAAGRIRTRKADYLLYALLDVVVDNYFHIIENIGDRQEAIEDNLAANKTDNALANIKACKDDIYMLRRSIFPLREAVSKIMRGASQLCEADTIKYLEDVHDHLIQLAELIENYREINTDLREIYLSTLSMRMNDIMKLLTIISTIFIPLSFVAGVYGTNFEVLPEISWPRGYLYFWIVCITIIVVMITYFKRKKWL